MEEREYRERSLEKTGEISFENEDGLRENEIGSSLRIEEIESKFEKPSERKRGIIKKERRENKRESRRESRREDTREKRRKKDQDIDLDSLAKQIFNFHLVLATLTNIQELLLSEDECYILAQALNDFINEFGIIVSTRIACIINLSFSIISIYVPRIILYIDRKRKEGQKSDIDKGGQEV